ncbi:uncharacterized protein [Littorina saxatilis]|uniref:uncharacterized protein n=1 Tax=Littorina saxatilis TaxID=31220 RepID=UPI0038B658EF
MPPHRTQRATSGRPPARHRSRSPQGRPQAEQAPTGQDNLGNQAPTMEAAAGPPQDPVWWQTPAAAQGLHPSSSPEVLILGSSIVRRLERDLVQWGRTLQLPLPVRFAGQSGLQFSGLRTLLECANERPPPAYLVLQVGANDIGRLNTIEWAQELSCGSHISGPGTPPLGSSGQTGSDIKHQIKKERTSLAVSVTVLTYIMESDDESNSVYLQLATSFTSQMDTRAFSSSDEEPLITKVTRSLVLIHLMKHPS